MGADIAVAIVELDFNLDRNSNLSDEQKEQIMLKIDKLQMPQLSNFDNQALKGLKD